MNRKVMDSRDFLSGGGELGALMRATDWSRTPLGPPAVWPNSLKTLVRIILTSRQPMFVWWGERLINLHNDAYRSILGGKHPWALGQPASEVWREIWDQVGPRAEQALRGNEGTYDEALLLIMERNGYPEETYYTFSYSPVPGDDGGIGGIICANTDDTQRIIGERQVTLLRELATRTGDARTIDDACSHIEAALRTDPRDLPFALLYLTAADRPHPALACSLGLAGTADAPAAHLADPALWPLTDVLRNGVPALIPDLGRRIDGLPCGAWDRPPSSAVALPIAAAGQSERAGVLIAGLNPYRMYDDSYQGFLGLVAGQVAAAVANAQTYQDERRRAEALAELDRAKTTFFSNASHEFRTPLTLMLGPLEQLLAEGAAHDAVPADRADLELMHRNGLRLLKLVNTLLDFSRIEAGRFQAVYEPVDLALFTAELASTFRSAMERAGLRFTVDCQALPAPVYIDRDMWEKIVLNLLSNAFKYTLAGEIAVHLRDTEGDAELTVQDTGVGIPRTELPRIFERFHRIEGQPGRTQEGTGIGLALVQELVRLHGGSVRADSRPGQGSTFSVIIPFGSTHLPADQLGAARTQA
ncbi:MAG TPA: HAMP domain-containing sensor histidine kinase, partial [Acetobacteraceae bacterium]|nr:HAMP domain-containing sensor histidine kinase [Acetobacteraceae bacterium]